MAGAKPRIDVSRVLESSEPSATRTLATALAGCLQAGDLIGLVGDLGAGKTLFVQSLAAALNVPDEVRVTSPTFTLINEYHGGSLPMYHADLYRLEKERELDELGLDDLCRRGDGVVLVEWADRFPALPRDHLQIHIDIVGPSERRFRCIADGKRSEALRDAWFDHL